MIAHICTLENWAIWEKQSAFVPESYAEEGFIHCSTHETLEESIQKYYSAEKEVVILWLNEEALKDDLKWEFAASRNANFPHIYSKIPREAILQVEKRKLT